MSKNEQKVTNEPTQKIEVRLDAKVDLRIDVDGVVTEIKPNNAAEGYSLKENVQNVQYGHCRASLFAPK